MSSPTKPVEQKARELLACPFCGEPAALQDAYLAQIMREEPSAYCWQCGFSLPVEKWNTRAALNTDEERIRREAFEEAAKVADMLGGVRERLPLIEGNNAEAKFRRLNRGQHVRAATIAKAIRSLSTPSKGVG